jgi:hypothetical protein
MSAIRCFDHSRRFHHHHSCGVLMRPARLLGRVRFPRWGLRLLIVVNHDDFYRVCAGRHCGWSMRPLQNQYQVSNF